MFLRKIGGVIAHAFVVMSSAGSLDLKDGKTYAAGYYLNGFVVPYRILVLKTTTVGAAPVSRKAQATSNNRVTSAGDVCGRRGLHDHGVGRSARGGERACYAPKSCVESSGNKTMKIAGRESSGYGGA